MKHWTVAKVLLHIHLRPCVTPEGVHEARWRAMVKQALKRADEVVEIKLGKSP